MSDKASEHGAWIEENKIMADLDVAGIVSPNGIPEYVILISDLREYLSKLSTYNEETHIAIDRKTAEFAVQAMSSDNRQTEAFLTSRPSYYEGKECPQYLIEKRVMVEDLRKALIDTADTKPITEKGDEG